MFKPRTFKFDCSNLLDEIEMAYQDLCDVLDLPFDGKKHQLMRTALAYLLEDTINNLTDPRFRDDVTLTKNLISSYFEHTVRLESIDLEDIEEVFVQPLTSEAMALIGKLMNSYDRYYSKWEIRESEEFPFMEIVYLGDYRIEEWHKIQDVPSRSPVAVKRHRIRYDDIADAIRDALRNVSDLAVNDIPSLIELIIRFYAGKQVDELYKEIVNQLKIINGFRQEVYSSKALKQVKSILKNIENIPSFSRFKEDAAIAETIYVTTLRTRIVFDTIMPGKNTNLNELRKEILDEIDQKGYVTGNVAQKVEIVYG